MKKQFTYGGMTFSAERIKELTMSRIQPAAAPRRTLRRFAIIAATIAVMLSLATAALAYSGLLSYSAVNDFISGFFGGDSGDGVVEYDDDGKLIVKLPAWERVPVDESLADRLIGGYITAVDQSISRNGYTLTAEANLYDPSTGCGLIYYTLKNPNGISGYQTFQDGEVWFDSTTVFAEVRGVRSSAPVFGKQYIDEGKSGDTRLYICEFYISVSNKPLSDILLVFGEYVPDKNGYIYGKEEEKIKIPLAAHNLSGAVFYTPGGDGAIKASPIGINIDAIALGLEHADEIKYVALEYADGSRYVVSDDAGFVNNSSYSLQPDGGGSRTYTFNRLVDIDNVVKVVVNEMELGR
ncbi:MAG: hypothetical protein LBK23_11305 [Oscillospiraceae bacterium]|jgi:hypothetical protein|nr:hypothetical protein [Oscillospiraceae bacterium]